MKKTISINIAGAIFYIEEDAYDKLKGYLASVQKYFSTFEGSREIIEDIEGRIAEKFTEKQKSNANQALTEVDVDGLIASMGTVADFEALAEQEDLVPKQPLGSANAENGQKNTEDGSSTAEPISGAGNLGGTEIRKLFRDTRRKLIGGVCAGIAHYMSVDPLWVRLITLVLFFGLAPLNGLGGTIFVLYVAFWIFFQSQIARKSNPKSDIKHKNSPT